MITQLSSKIVYKNAWMTVREDDVAFSNGHKGIYGVVHKTDFALIIPFDGENLHVVQQYRYPTQQHSIEFPQGMHQDDPQIDPLELAKAELLEETGLEARSMIHLGSLHEAPGYSDQGFHIYFATDLNQKETNLEITEAGLERMVMSIKEFEAAILSGNITDASTVSAYGLLRMKKLLP